MSDAVNHPSHYNNGKVECIDGLESALGGEGFIAFCIGNTVKYCWRGGHKGSRKEDYKKAMWYLQKAINALPEEGSKVEASSIGSRGSEFKV